MSHHGFTDEKQQQRFFCVLLRAKQTERQQCTKRARQMEMDKDERKRRGTNRGKTSSREDLVNKYIGSRFCLGAMLAVFHGIPCFNIRKHTSLLTSLPSTLVGVGSGCSFYIECVLAVLDHPTVTLLEGLPGETSNSVHTFL